MPRSSLFSVFLLVGMTAFARAARTPSAPAAPLGAASNVKQFDAQIRPFLEQHCVECHSGDKPKGDMRLDKITANFSDDATRKQWQNMLDRLTSGEMPPKKKPRPAAAELKSVCEWIVGNVHSAEVALRATEGRVVMRRLNRNEYDNTVRDLLGVSVNLKDVLPMDSSSNGFDNVGEALHTSSFLMDQYLIAADTALSVAIANYAQPRTIKKHYSLKESHQIKSSEEDVYRKLPGDGVVLFSSSAWNAVGLTPFYQADRGNYRFRLTVSAIQSAGKPVVFRVLSGGGGMGGAKSHLVSYFDAPADKPTVIEFIDYMEPHTTISILPYGLAGAQTIKKTGAEKWDGPGIVFDSVDVEGPLNEVWPPQCHRDIFGNLPQGKAPIYNHFDRLEVVSKDPVADADRILRKFIRRAFRRPVTDIDVLPFMNLVMARLAEKYSFEQAMRVGLLGVMVSPEFLFLDEKPGRLDDTALASRMSYFFWSSMPDEELLALAEQKKLSQPGVLHAQVERMLKDPKSKAFTENFTGQWLALRDIDFTEPSQLLYPEFDDMLKVSMLKETHLFFDEVLNNDLSLTNFITSDFTMLNGRLAKHYDIPGVDGWQFRKVTLPPGTHRGGLLTMGSVLKVTANGTSTSPVLRGAWVLDRILGTPPPRPPENVAALEPDIRGATTIREQLAKHRHVATCAGCHTKIDPPGFALESFDVTGGYRENYRTSGNGKAVVINGRHMSYHTGLKVDPSDVLPDGRKFANIDEFKQLLLEQKDQVARALASKLLTYGTGAAPDSADQPAIEGILAKTKAKNYGFRTLIHEIVESELFRTK